MHRPAAASLLAQLRGVRPAWGPLRDAGRCVPQQARTLRVLRATDVLRAKDGGEVQVRLRRRRGAAPAGDAPASKRNLMQNFEVPEVRAPSRPTVASRGERPVDAATAAQMERRKERRRARDQSIRQYLPRAVLMASIVDFAAWSGLGVAGHCLGLVDLLNYQGVVESYPLHTFIPIPFVKEIVSVVGAASMWQTGYLAYRVPYLLFVGYITAERYLVKADPGNRKVKTLFAELTPDGWFVRNLWYGVEIVCIVIGSTFLLDQLGLGHCIHDALPPWLVEYLTAYNPTVRGFFGTNDFPTDEQVTCLSLAMVVGEVYTAWRFNLTSAVTRIGRALAGRAGDGSGHAAHDAGRGGGRLPPGAAAAERGDEAAPHDAEPHAVRDAEDRGAAGGHLSRTRAARAGDEGRPHVDHRARGRQAARGGPQCAGAAAADGRHGGGAGAGEVDEPRPAARAGACGLPRRRLRALGGRALRHRGCVGRQRRPRRARLQRGRPRGRRHFGGGGRADPDAGRVPAGRERGDRDVPAGQARPPARLPRAPRGGRDRGARGDAAHGHPRLELAQARGQAHHHRQPRHARRARAGALHGPRVLAADAAGRAVAERGAIAGGGPHAAVDGEVADGRQTQHRRSRCVSHVPHHALRSQHHRSQPEPDPPEPLPLSGVPTGRGAAPAADRRRGLRRRRRVSFRSHHLVAVGWGGRVGCRLGG